MPSDLARAASDLFRVVRALPEAPDYLRKQIRALSSPMTKTDGAIESVLALWDVTRCEELPAWARLEADRIRQRLWRAAFLKGKALEQKLQEICER